MSSSTPIQPELCARMAARKNQSFIKTFKLRFGAANTGVAYSDGERLTLDFPFGKPMHEWSRYEVEAWFLSLIPKMQKYRTKLVPEEGYVVDMWHLAYLKEQGLPGKDAARLLRYRNNAKKKAAVAAAAAQPPQPLIRICTTQVSSDTTSSTTRHSTMSPSATPASSDEMSQSHGVGGTVDTNSGSVTAAVTGGAATTA
ncbi:hypothetical protein Vretimale_6514 [Volvox reticuliferus]|uniref:Uncharacterized protein n=1 Tax=Volvox reticuliferus TaxID=1737510 RepID=A0A8J4FNB4_9CHLO|nr:hypothetical protein Vretifemale_7313 [Volvox reticuliferus]GIM01847.1 hypothetical protein Vretimale_6514 [Volvox reticuliferus]